MLHNRLKLNPSKTDFLLIGHEQQRKKSLFSFTVTLMGIDANPSACARNLGVVFDQNFNNFRNIYLGFAAPVFTTLVTCAVLVDIWILTMQNHYVAYALVTSRLEYCNSVLRGVAGKGLERLQRVHNILACAVNGSRPFVHAAPSLQSIHWLPIKFRIKFKTALLTFKIRSVATCKTSNCKASNTNLTWYSIWSRIRRMYWRSANPPISIPFFLSQSLTAHSGQVRVLCSWNRGLRQLQGHELLAFVPLISGTPFLCHCACRYRFRVVSRNWKPLYLVLPILHKLWVTRLGFLYFNWNRHRTYGSC